MNQQTFKANLALLDRRWPWPEGADDAQEDYRARLWARAEGWRKEFVTAFRTVVEQLVASQRWAGRPAVDEITAAVYSRLGGKNAVEVSAAQTRAERISGDVRAFLESRWIRHDSTVAWIRSYISDVAVTELERLWPNLIKWRDCPKCQFGMVLVRGGDKNRTHYDCLGCKHVWTAKERAADLRGVEFDPVEEMTPLEREKHEAILASPWAKKLSALLPTDDLEDLPF